MLDATELRKRVGANVAALRKKAGMSQEKLADLVSLNKQTIWRIESGASNVSLETLARVAGPLGVAPADLLLSDGHGPLGASAMKVLDAVIASMRATLTLTQELRPALRRIS